jgi:hypothetical protein
LYVFGSKNFGLEWGAKPFFEKCQPENLIRLLADNAVRHDEHIWGGHSRIQEDKKIHGIRRADAQVRMQSGLSDRDGGCGLSYALEQAMSRKLRCRAPVSFMRVVTVSLP